MSDPNTGNGEVRKHLGPFLTASVALALYILIFEVITTSRNMALAFNIPNQYVGIYFDKVFALSNSFTTIGSAIDIAIYYAVMYTNGSKGTKTQNVCKQNPETGKEKTEDLVRKCISITFLGLMFLCRTIFVIILYKSNSMSYHFYILFSIEAFFFGFAQISYFAFAGEFSSANTLAINCSALLAFLVQSILDWIIPSNPLKMLRIHSFICFGLTLFSLGSWPYFLFWFDHDYEKTEEKKTETKQLTCSVQGSSARLSLSLSSSLCPLSDRSSSILLYVSELNIIDKIIIELKNICSCCNNLKLSITIQTCISNLLKISCVSQINYDLITILHLVIVGIQKEVSSQNCMVLKQLVLLLEIKMNIREAVQSTQTSVVACPTILSVSCTGDQEQAKQITQDQSQNHCASSWHEHFGKSMSRFLLFHIPSFFKDFLFPGVLPFGLLDMNNCKLAIKLVPIFSVLGSLTNYIWTTVDGDRDKEWNSPHHYEYIWLLLIPMIIVYICSISAIHSNKRFFRAIVNSQWRVIIMMLPLLYFYAFMENVSYSGVAGYVFGCKDTPKYVLETHNLSCMIFRYLFGKLAVGYSNVRIKSGYVLPNFKPVRGLDDTFCYWFCNIFKQAGIDIGKDFRLSIREYL